MAKIKGTNGNDTLTGTATDDTITPLLGQDSVDGGGGYDTLVVDYSSLADVYSYSTMTLGVDGGWTGAVTGGASSAPNSVGFQNVEQVKFTATQADDYMVVNLGALAPDKSRATLDGAGGDDTLAVVGAGLAKRLTLVVDGLGNAKANFGALAGWDNYDISLGVASGNNLVLGGGDDRVSSQGGQDTIDGGAGHDFWTGDYSARTDDLNLFISGDFSVQTENAQLATVTNVEEYHYQAGSGDDVVNIFGGIGYLNGGDGYDQFALNPFGAAAPMRYEVYQANAAIVAGTATVLGTVDQTIFSEFEFNALGGSVGNDIYVLDASQFQVTNGDLETFFNAGDGYDELTLDLSAQTAAKISQDSAGDAHVDGLAAANFAAWYGMEKLTATMGAGDDTVDFAVASKVLTLDGGAGFDTIDISDATAGITLYLGSSAQQNVNGVYVTLVHVEGVIGSTYTDYLVDTPDANRLQGMGGADTIYSSASSLGGVDVFEGGAGVDTMDYEFAAGAVYVSLATTAAQNTGGGGTDTLSGFEVLVGSAYSDRLTGSAAGETLNGVDGDDVLEGLGGDDILYGFTGNDTASYANAAAAVTVAIDITSAQNTLGAGFDTLQSIENLVGSTFGDTLRGDAAANRLSGGRGADKLTGLGGADVFSYSSTLDSTGSTYDNITDFSHAQGDKINLSAVDAIASTPRLNDAFTWIGSDAFHGVAGELRELGARGGGYFLYGDTNGDKVADLVIFVNSTTPLVPNSDIVL